MAFFNRTKKINNKTRTTSIPELWETGKIEAIQVHLSSAVGLYAGAAGFYDYTNMVKLDVKDHNEANNRYREVVERIAAGAEYREKSLDISLLSLHKKEKERMLFNLNNRNTLDITRGFLELECLRECEMLRQDNAISISKETLVSYCMLPAVQQAAAEKMKNEGHEKRSEMVLTEEQISFYYEACAQYLKLFHEENTTGGNGKTADMFTENGLIMLQDADGRYQLAEEDYFAEYEEIDYMGLV